MKTNNELGAVYLEVEGLDKERFKELTKGMAFWGGCVDAEWSDDRIYLENYGGFTGAFEWMSVYKIYYESRKITLDELEELLHEEVKPTHFAISPEDYKEYQELKKLKEKNAGTTFSYCLDSDKSFKKAQRSKEGYRNIELICKNYTHDGLDLIFAYDEVKELGVLYLGNFVK